MKKKTRSLSLSVLFSFLLTGIMCMNAQNIQNPVLPGIADAGVIRYNGKYYIGGVFTDGDFYISTDLVNWEGPVHVFSMDNDWTRGSGAGNDQIHANDIRYLNGEFHMYWSVNYWGADKHAVHIAHTVANDILGPYVEPVKNTWMDNRIDPMVFRDDDGKLYMYGVRFTDGNTIWVRPMKDWATFDGPPVYQFASLPATWETMDNRVAEGPWTIKYRDRYYMIYNANHTGTPWGNYQFGVAEADSPVSFNHGNKYPYPVLSSNQVALEENFADLLRFGKTYTPLFTYTEAQPSGNWKSISYDASGWKEGKGGFAAREIEGSTTRKQGTVWTSPELYVRKPFEVQETTVGNLALRVTHNGETKVFLNETLIYEQATPGYCIVNLTKEQRKALQNGTNLLTAETKGGRNNYFNASLFDMKREVADDIMYCPGQPNILRGPNGFEWWLVYMADKNNERRSQYINRVHFFDKTLYTDGISAGNTKGYFPEPAKPTYGDTFDSAANWTASWTIPAEWSVTNGELVANSRELTESYLKNGYESTACWYEAAVKTAGQAGIIPYRKDANNWVRIGLDAEKREWFIEQCVEGQTARSAFSLPDDFRFDAYHSLQVERNYTTYTVRIDEIPAPGGSVFSGLPCEEGVAGLFACGRTAFDGLVYTAGWDESGTGIEAWQETGASVRTAKGLQTTSSSYQALKGDFREQYEYALQITNESMQGAAGVYPVYIDGKNYVKALLNYDNRTLEVVTVKKRKRGGALFLSVGKPADPLRGCEIYGFY